jgi:tetratricopeptide (TPR) repeat protein
VYERLGDVREWAVTMGQVASIKQARGELDEALRILLEEELPVYERLGAVRERAVTMGKVADIKQARGELDEALCIRMEEELPVYERLGDVHSRALTMGKVANIKQTQGEIDEVLRILRNETLPAFEKLGDLRSLIVSRTNLAVALRLRGRPAEDASEVTALLASALRDARHLQLPTDIQIISDLIRELGGNPDAPPFAWVRERAVAMGKVADIKQARGELDEALRIRLEEEVPVYEQLGDVRGRAVAMGKVADIKQARGELDEALRILRNETLPAFEKLGDLRSLIVSRTNLANGLLQRRRSTEDGLEAVALLAGALRDARHLQLPADIQFISNLIGRLGCNPDAPPFA